jgi:hypothetical protein
MYSVRLALIGPTSREDDIPFTAHSAAYLPYQYYRSLLRYFTLQLRLGHGRKWSLLVVAQSYSRYACTWMSTPSTTCARYYVLPALVWMSCSWSAAQVLIYQAPKAAQVRSSCASTSSREAVTCCLILPSVLSTAFDCKAKGAVILILFVSPLDAESTALVTAQ